MVSGQLELWAFGELAWEQNKKPPHQRDGCRGDEKNKRGIKLSHRTCRSTLENADRFAMGPKSDLLSDPGP
jgi:hypothetical protein